MPRPTTTNQDKALQLLKAALGDFEPKRSLDQIISNTKDFGTFEWMLTIIGLEIDLCVDIPESLADDHSRSANEFCKLVAKLPRIDSPGYTLECLGMVAQALLSLDLPVQAEKQAKTKRPTSGAKKSVRKRVAQPGVARKSKAAPSIPTRRTKKTTAGAGRRRVA